MCKNKMKATTAWIEETEERISELEDKIMKKERYKIQDHRGELEN